MMVRRPIVINEKHLTDFQTFIYSDSFLEGELMDTTDIDLSQKEIKKPPAKSRSRRNQSKRASPKKASPKKTVELECSDDDGTDNEVTPGVGQKTAFKKLDKLKSKLKGKLVNRYSLS